mgnify:CR=1 FL=1
MDKIKLLKKQIKKISKQRDEVYLENLKLKTNYCNQRNFIDSLWVHTETDDNKNYDILRTEMNAVGNRVEQNLKETLSFHNFIMNSEITIFD